MNVEVYCFEFATMGELERVGYVEDYIYDMIFERNCKPFLTFNGVSELNFNLEWFVKQVNKSVFEIVRANYLKNVYYHKFFVAYRVVNSKKKWRLLVL